MTSGARRIVSSSFGVGSGFAAIAIWMTRDLEAFLPAVWTAWFAATAGVVLAFAVHPDSETLWRWSGAMVAAALTSRLGAVLLNINEGNYSSPWRGAVGLVWITGAAWGVRVTWLHLLAPRRL